MNKEVWKKTHELAGKIWFYTGLAAALVTLIISEEFAIYISISVFAIIVLIPVIYSYFAFRQIEKDQARE